MTDKSWGAAFTYYISLLIDKLMIGVNVTKTSHGPPETPQHEIPLDTLRFCRIGKLNGGQHIARNRTAHSEGLGQHIHKRNTVNIDQA
jgi:hypothetical protein